MQEVSKIRDAVLDHTLTDKNDKLNALKKTADEIFSPAATMKLALLAKMWYYDALYESCKARIVAEPLPHVSSQLWKNPTLATGATCTPPCLHVIGLTRDTRATGLVTEVLVMLPAATVIAIDDLQPPQVCHGFPPPAT